MYNNSTVSYYTLIYPNFMLLYATVSELYPIRTILLYRSVSYVSYCMLVSYCFVRYACILLLAAPVFDWFPILPRAKSERETDIF